jgi:hypothetical protein
MAELSNVDEWLDATARATAPAVRLTLMWTTPQPAHRSDPEERNPDGTMAPPPPTLTAFYVISTNGATDEQHAIGAHD